MFPFTLTGTTKILTVLLHPTWEQEGSLLRVPFWDMFAVVFLMLLKAVLHAEGNEGRVL